MLSGASKMSMPCDALPRSSVPVASVPMRLPSISVVLALTRSTPRCALPEITLPAPAATPPIVFAEPPVTSMPSLPLPIKTVPSTPTPM